MKKLKSLKAHNNKRENQPKFVNNGFACPDCGNELIDLNPYEILASYPPKKSVSCSDCGYKGYRTL